MKWRPPLNRDPAQGRSLYSTFSLFAYGLIPEKMQVSSWKDNPQNIYPRMNEQWETFEQRSERCKKLPGTLGFGSDNLTKGWHHIASFQG